MWQGTGLLIRKIQFLPQNLRFPKTGGDTVFQNIFNCCRYVTQDSRYSVVTCCELVGSQRGEGEEGGETKHGCCLKTGNPTSVARRCVPLRLYHGHRPTALKQMTVSILQQYLYYLRWLVTGISQRSPEFHAKAMHLEVLKNRCGRFFFQYFRFTE